MEEKLTGSVLAVNGRKTLVLVNGRDYYILRDYENPTIGENITFETKDSLPMPSYLFAIAALEEPDLDSVLSDIRSKWFKD